jgi:5-methyltetrahydropteroyltriglutamate--homocysteine methyltransferase
MKTNNLGYPRIGSDRELKKANEQYWSGKISADTFSNRKNIRKKTGRFNLMLELI